MRAPSARTRATLTRVLHTGTESEFKRGLEWRSDDYHTTPNTGRCRDRPVIDRHTVLQRNLGQGQKETFLPHHRLSDHEPERTLGAATQATVVSGTCCSKIAGLRREG